MITVTITDKLQEAGANAAWIAANNPEQADAQAYLQAVLESACISYASQFSVDRVTSGEFVLRFKPEEYAGIALAAETDVVVKGFLDATRINPTVRLADQQVVQGLAYLVQSGLITEERSAEIAFYPIPSKPEPEVVPEPVVEEPVAEPVAEEPIVEPEVQPEVSPEPSVEPEAQPEQPAE